MSSINWKSEAPLKSRSAQERLEIGELFIKAADQLKGSFITGSLAMAKRIKRPDGTTGSRMQVDCDSELACGWCAEGAMGKVSAEITKGSDEYEAVESLIRNARGGIMKGVIHAMSKYGVSVFRAHLDAFQERFPVITNKRLKEMGDTMPSINDTCGEAVTVAVLEKAGHALMHEARKELGLLTPLDEDDLLGLGIADISDSEVA